jgi:hypothetical protein
VGPAADTQYSRFFAWRNVRKFLLEKLVFNIAMGHSVTFVAGSPNFDSFSITLRQYYNGGNKDVITPTGNIATGHSALGASGVQSYIYEEPYNPNVVIERDSILVVGVVMNVTAGSGGTTRSEGIYPSFPYSKLNVLKWMSQSGYYMLGRALD